MIRLAAIALLLCGCGPSPGHSCGGDPDCGDDLVCLKPSGAGNGVCSFAFSEAGARCLSNGDCASDLFCSNDLSSETRMFAGVCQPLQGLDGACSRSANCRPPLVCTGAAQGQLGTCQSGE